MGLSVYCMSHFESGNFVYYAMTTSTKTIILQNGWTPLQVASQHGHIGVANVLLDHGAKVDFMTRVIIDMNDHDDSELRLYVLCVDGLECITHCYSRWPL